jgi:hypothetical protein
MVIITDSLSTMMAVSDRKRSKNPKTQTIRKLMDQKPSNITLLWVPSHVGIPENETADNAAKEALDKEKKPPQDLIKWMKNKQQKEQEKKWERSTSTMKERKHFFEKNTNTKTLNRREQVVVSRLRIGYTRATHASFMNKDLSTECPFCAVKVTVDHIL